METLKGKTILIGKEPGQGRLLVAVGGKAAALGAPGSVPTSVSRCKTMEGVAHVKITVDHGGNMVLTNMKPQNVTYVNGAEIESKRVLPSSTVELGRDRFSLSLPAVLETARKISVAAPQQSSAAASAPEPEKVVNIRHLAAVYDDYHTQGIDRQKKQKKLGILASCSMFFTIGGGAFAAIANKLGIGETAQDYLWILPVVGFIVFLVSMYMRVNDNSIEDADTLNQQYQRRFVCPNCGKFLGNMSYELLKTQCADPKDRKMRCPHRCGAVFVER